MSTNGSHNASTPMMKQYWSIKSVHPDKILLYRMGDFFEMFFDDAVTASAVIGIALTQRNKKGTDETPMCGVPHHSIAGPIRKLLAAGHKVAICDQIEDPKTAKGIVKRAVTRVLTPGMIYDLDSLDDGRPLYVASYDSSCAAFLDTTTGDAFWVNVSGPRELDRLLQVMDVAELVLDQAGADKRADTLRVSVSVHGETEDTAGLPPPAARLISYIRSLSNGNLLSIAKPFVQKNLGGRMHLSPTVLKHLEIFKTYKGDEAGSFFASVDRTRTSGGKRLWRQWLQFPLMNPEEISARLEIVARWRDSAGELKNIRERLGAVGDIERRLGKIALPTCNGRELLSLAASTQAAIEIIASSQSKIRESILTVESAHKLKDLCVKLERTLLEEQPLSTKQGHLIRKGVSIELDELIELATNAQGLLAKLEEREKQATGISSLKIRYNSVFGYYIEITNTHKDKAPAHYQRKQTLANAERYCTDELVELERKVLSAESRRNEIESLVYDQLRNEVLGLSRDFLAAAAQCSELDVQTALAWLSLEKNYTRPEFSKEMHVELRSSRHPVVEQLVGSKFVANDICLDPREVMLLTGPNMAGKSTLMRQVALSSIMAQAGSYVPAKKAVLPLFDSIYTRIGASDQLSEGLSTFMVEMTEVAELLDAATEKSLIVLDEIGRGTSTYDGMSLAQSILEYLIGEVKAVTLFATHYHELTQLERLWPQIHNAHMSVVDKGGEIRFLHTLVRGAAGKSYGVQVAELAGVPSAITKRAKQLLRDLEAHSTQGPAQQQLSLHAMAESPLPTAPAEEPSVDLQKYLPLLKDIQDTPISAITPLDALNKISRWQESCRDLS